MLLVGWKRHLDTASLEADPIGEMERLYKKVNAECKADPATLEEARQELVKLQGGDAENLAIWRKMQSLSQAQFDTHLRSAGGEVRSHPGRELLQPAPPGRGGGTGARAASPAKAKAPGACSRTARSRPRKIRSSSTRKANGGPIPASSRRATARSTTPPPTSPRWPTGWKPGSPDEIIYVTDGRQQLHFRQIFATFRRWHPEAQVSLAHVWFGSILGEDGKPFKTRSGDTVKLADLLDEAEERAFQVVTEKNPDLAEAQRREIARVVGLGAVKYADLLPNRQSDYVFSWDKMLALNGNTAPYLQYAYTRIRSIFRKARAADVAGHGRRGGFAARCAGGDRAGQAPAQLRPGAGGGGEKSTGRISSATTSTNWPGISRASTRTCPVLKAEGAERASRLALCDLTARVLKQGLEVLGIETLEQM